MLPKYISSTALEKPKPKLFPLLPNRPSIIVAKEITYVATEIFTNICKKVHKIRQYVVKFPKEKLAYHSHDDATSLSF